MLTKSLDKIMLDYTKKDCKNFSDEERASGYFEAVVTGYCKPLATDYENRDDFLCAVGLNCRCPAGRADTANCALNTKLSWAACNDFDDQTVDYCNLTASLAKPGKGQIAADWECFAPNSSLEIDGQSYQVTDKGGAIKGRRFDIWFDDCQDAIKATGIYNVRLPN